MLTNSSPSLSEAVPAHLGDTHIAQIRGGRVMVVLADPCLFISCFSEISHCVWCSRKTYRMILTLCYPFFTTELGLRIHTSVRNRNLKLPLSTYCMRLRCYHVDLHTLQICKVEVFPPAPNCKAKNSVSNERGDSKYGTLATHTSGRPLSWFGPHRWHPWFKA